MVLAGAIVAWYEHKFAKMMKDSDEDKLKMNSIFTNKTSTKQIYQQSKYELKKCSYF
jgi:hypothetical protein